MAVTIKQIAALAGVSRGTVDRVLNNRGGVSAQTQRKVREIAAGLGYSPNRVGKALAARKKPLLLGVVMPSQGNGFFDKVQEGIDSAAGELRDYGVTVEVRTMRGFDSGVQLGLIRQLEEKGVDGLAIAPINSPEIARHLEELARRDIPVVTFNSDIEGGKRLCYVGNDYLKSGQTAAGLMGLMIPGGAQVVVITGSTQMLGHNQRIQGFRRCLEEEGLGIRILDIFENGDDDFTSYELTKQAMARYPQLDAIYMTAGGVYGTCRALEDLTGGTGFFKGKKIRLITFDRQEHTRRYLESGILDATICQDPYIQGYRPIKILFEWLLGGKAPEAEFLYTSPDIRIKQNL